MLDSHLSMYVKFNLSMLVSLFLCSLFMDVCKFWIAPMCVVEGALAIQYGIVCHVYLGGGGYFFKCFFLFFFCMRWHLLMCLLHPNLRNIIFHNVTSSPISQNPRERMCSI